MAMVLAALRGFDLRAVLVSTMQAVSGAGYPGLPSFDILGNVVPYIGGEEEKMETESRKILGSLSADGVDPHPMVVSAHANRVPVINGHTETLSLASRRRRRPPTSVPRSRASAAGRRSWRYRRRRRGRSSTSMSRDARSRGSTPTGDAA